MSILGRSSGEQRGSFLCPGYRVLPEIIGRLSGKRWIVEEEKKKKMREKRGFPVLNIILIICGSPRSSNIQLRRWSQTNVWVFAHHPDRSRRGEGHHQRNNLSSEVAGRKIQPCELYFIEFYSVYICTTKNIVFQTGTFKPSHSAISFQFSYYQGKPYVKVSHV